MATNYSNSIVTKFVTSGEGVAGAGQLVTVRLEGSTTNAVLFDEAGSTIDNPTQADGDGNYSFYIDDGAYDIYIDLGLPTQTAILNEQIANIIVTPPLTPDNYPVKFLTLDLAVSETNPLKAFINSFPGDKNV